jgi:Na+/H+ antiporter NhaD/arsenite permease-like protein
VAAPAAWHHHYGKISGIWALLYLLPFGAVHGLTAVAAALVHVALDEYVPFVVLLGTLFVVAGGLRLTGTPRGTPGVNTALLALGTLLAGIIGTTGAAMIMVRPMIRANRHRRRATHVFLFLIFLVANIGGALSPLGDPPLFLGFLAGVPFFWPTRHLLLPMLLLSAALLALFYVIDRVIHHRHPAPEPDTLGEIEKLGLQGKINLPLIAAVIASVLLRGLWEPATRFTFFAATPWGTTLGLDDLTSELLLVGIAVLSLGLTPRGVRQANDFAWEPMIEVAAIFAALFITIAPVLAIIEAGSAGSAAPLFNLLSDGGRLDPHAVFWATGLLSALLDNAPTYLVFFNAAGGDPAALATAPDRVLLAISAAAVFFGALTYVGNAPNFMVRTIVQSHGIPMPGFFVYLGQAALFLLPLLALIGLIFVR